MLATPQMRSRARAARDRRRRCRRRARPRPGRARTRPRRARARRPSTPALVQVEGDPDGTRKDDPDDEAAELPAHVERGHGTERLRAKRGAPARRIERKLGSGTSRSRMSATTAGAALTRPPAPRRGASLLRLAPGDVELGVRDAVPEHEVDERRVLTRPRVDLPQEREELLVAEPAQPGAARAPAPAEGRPRRRASAGSRRGAPASAAAPPASGRARPDRPRSACTPSASGAPVGELFPSTRPASSRRRSSG